MKLTIGLMFCAIGLLRGAEFTGQVQAVRRTSYVAGPRYPTSTNEFRPYIVFTGSNTKIKQRECSLISTREAWVALWLRHTDQDPEGMYIDGKYTEWSNPGGVPTVDFTRCVVVALTQGVGFNSEGFDVAGVATEGETTRLRLAEKWYQSVGKGTTVAVYGFFVMPRSDKVLVVEENDQHFISGPPIWKERGRFEKTICCRSETDANKIIDGLKTR